jgi:hypothetical protein
VVKNREMRGCQDSSLGITGDTHGA